MFDNQLIFILNSTSSFFLSTQSTRLLTLINPTVIYNICIVFWIFWSVEEYLPIFLCFIEIGRNWKYRTSNLPSLLKLNLEPIEHPKNQTQSEPNKMAKDRWFFKAGFSIKSQNELFSAPVPLDFRLWSGNWTFFFILHKWPYFQFINGSVKRIVIWLQSYHSKLRSKEPERNVDPF